MTTRPADPLAEAHRQATPGAWLKFAEQLYAQHNLALGQIATTAHDEALYLILHTLSLSMDSDESVLFRKLTQTERGALTEVFRRRVVDHTPAAYITKEAWLNDEKFYVDERVLIPRSYFLEIIPEQLDDLLPDATKVTRVVDVCTGSGCLAILLAKHFPQARVDGVDLSPEALEVAKINVRDHKLTKRITLHASDVFDAVPPVLYDLILSNPPYEPSAHCDALPDEFKREPRLALDGGGDGLDIIRKLLWQAKSRLKPQGVVLIEVGGLGEAMEREFPTLDLRWLPTEDESNCICLIEAAAVKTWCG